VTETAASSLLGRAGPEIRLDIHQLHLSNYSRVIHSQASIPDHTNKCSYLTLHGGSAKHQHFPAGQTGRV